MTVRQINTSNLSDLIHAFQPFTVGMDAMLKDLDRYHGMSSGSYPPYNIIDEDEGKWTISMAVAGFGEKDIEVAQKDQDLTIKGKVDKEKEDKYIHQGIANRAFTRSFKLGLHVLVQDCKLLNGMLSINLEKIIPEEERPRIIPINN